jgi:hypothetical protein
MPSSPPTGGVNMFKNNASDRKIRVSSFLLRTYRTAQFWADYKSEIVGFALPTIDRPDRLPGLDDEPFIPGSDTVK